MFSENYTFVALSNSRFPYVMLCPMLVTLHRKKKKKKEEKKTESTTSN